MRTVLETHTEANRVVLFLFKLSQLVYSISYLELLEPMHHITLKDSRRVHSKTSATYGMGAFGI